MTTDVKSAPKTDTKEMTIGDGNHGVGNSIAKANTERGEIIEAEFTGEIPDISQLDEMEVGKSRVAKYRTQEDWQQYKDKPIRCFFLGIKEIPNDQGELIKCGVFVDKTGVFLSAQKMIMDAVIHMVSNKPLLITYKGKKPNKSSQGSTNIFDVAELVPDTNQLQQ